jgi:hypothetical protein
MKNVMGITDVLCQALQQKSQDILNAMHLVTTTKTLIQKLRDDGWETLLKEVTSFCKHIDIKVPDMDACFSSVGRSCHKQILVTVKHYYQIDIFTAIIDQQLQELNSIFNEQTIELLKLSTTLDRRNNYKLFNVFGHTTTICPNNKVDKLSIMKESKRENGVVRTISLDNKQN